MDHTLNDSEYGDVPTPIRSLISTEKSVRRYLFLAMLGETAAG